MSPPDEKLYLPHLLEKVRLLYGNATYRTNQGSTAPLLNQKQLAQALEIDAGDLSRALTGNIKAVSTPVDHVSEGLRVDVDGNLPPFLPGRVLPHFLRLFGLEKVPDRLAPDDPWRKVAALPFEEFLAEVKRRGGLEFLRSPWDRFVAARFRPLDPPEGKDKAGEKKTVEGLTIESRVAADWRRARRDDRLLAPGQPNPAAEESNLPVHYVGDRARITLAVGQTVRERPLHVFIFQDVVIDGRRRFIPLLPAPSAGFVMPKPLLPNPDLHDDFLLLPCGGTPDNPQLFEVPSAWGLRRRLTAVVAQKAMGADVYDARRDQWEIAPERLDRLAERLESRAYGAWALFVQDYLALARPMA
ncbi:hypothetical protein [Candidatus Accumulibacter vicinus]|uniref:Uncharacterized protein n=1 Tax=Candidatus Accumulibacter vicinus TaxID=2954382 RepID=A0A084Y4J5_9PROT|nr:hypothetical protein [Candidatus Accumulibacter vicinus]KFB69639.1 MAG: hypothetical protein CAPSK01_000698 [Candidatus Accumulibacter vicinus]